MLRALPFVVFVVLMSINKAPCAVDAGPHAARASHTTTDGGWAGVRRRRRRRRPGAAVGRMPPAVVVVDVDVVGVSASFQLKENGSRGTMSPGERETIAVKCHYRPRVARLWRTDPHRSESANNAQSHCRPQCFNQCRKSSREKMKIVNQCATTNLAW